MKPVTFALLFFFLPVAAQAQNQSGQERSSGKKMQWAGVGTLAGGVGLIVLSAVSGKEPVTRSIPSTTEVARCSPPGPGLVTVVECTIGIGGQPPTSTLPPITVTTMTTVFEQRRVVNWTIVGPAIGVAGAGALLAHLGHVRVKKAELSVRPSGAVQFAFNW